jgi:ADP-heptose:LPS heptosyltransferase
MGKSNFLDKTLNFLFTLLSRDKRAGLLRWIIRTSYKPPSLVFPWNLAEMKKALFILPEETVDAFHQINNYLRLLSLLKTAKVTIVCTKEIGPFFKLIYPDAVFIEYEKSSRFVFSREFREIGKMVSEEDFDICFLLERNPDMTLLFLAGKTASPVRAGYGNAGNFPFLNMHVNPSDKNVYLASSNAVMAQTFGAPERATVRIGVARETMDEIHIMTGEMQIPRNAVIVGIDAAFLVKSFGIVWTERLCSKISENKNRKCCLLIIGEAGGQVSEFISSAGLPVFPNLSPSRCAALIMRCTCIVSGRSAIFELANMMGRPAIGIFEKELSPTYFKQTATAHGRILSGEPDEDDIISVAELIDTVDKIHTK